MDGWCKDTKRPKEAEVTKISESRPKIWAIVENNNTDSDSEIEIL